MGSLDDYLDGKITIGSIYRNNAIRLLALLLFLLLISGLFIRDEIMRTDLAKSGIEYLHEHLILPRSIETDCDILRH